MDMRLGFEQQKEFSELRRLSLRLGLNAAVVKIAHEAGQPKPLRKLTSGIAKADELHLAEENHMPSFELLIHKK